MKKQLLLPLALFVSFAGFSGFSALVPGRAIAHQVETNYLQTDKMLELETVFSTGMPLPNADVRVYAPGNPDEPWLEGKTDENGKFAFEPDSNIPGDWEVFIKDRGHADILTVPVSDQGVELEMISDAGSVDMHHSPSPVGLVAVVLSSGLLGGGLLWKKRHKA